MKGQYEKELIEMFETLNEELDGIRQELCNVVKALNNMSVIVATWGKALDDPE